MSGVRLQKLNSGRHTMKDEAELLRTEFVVSAQEARQRLDLFLATILKSTGFSRQRVKQFIQAGCVKVNDRQVTLARHEVFAGDSVICELPHTAESKVLAQTGDLSIIYQSSDFLVLNKPPGMTVHPCPSCPENTLVNILLHHFPVLGDLPGLRPGIVHRLDKDTSGLLLVALNEHTRAKLAESFKQREVKKRYLALVSGVPHEKEGIINEPIARHPKHKTRNAVVPGGREAISKYRVLASGDDFALLEVDILTGRTHQIRVHLAHIGYPVLGDTLYGGCKHARKPGSQPVPERQMLHAWQLEFKHPDSGEPLAFTCPLPEDFRMAVKELSAVPLRVVITGLPGSGKSCLLSELGRLGLPVWSADKCVADLYKPGADGWQLIKSRFGGRFIDEDSGSLDKRSLFKAMIEVPGMRREVEELIHPLVSHCLNDFWHNSGMLSVAEVPLFFEAGWQDDGHVLANIIKSIPVQLGIECHEHASGSCLIIGVDCPKDVRYGRLKTRGLSDSDVAAFNLWQWAEKEKMAACHLVVDNSGSLEDLKAKAKVIFTILEQISADLNTALADKVFKTV